MRTLKFINDRVTPWLTLAVVLYALLFATGRPVYNAIHHTKTYVIHNCPKDADAGILIQNNRYRCVTSVTATNNAVK